MKLKKPKKEDVPIFVISTIFVVMMAVSSALAKSEETGKPLEFYQWAIINLFIIGIAVIVDIGIIDYKERKKIIEEENKKREKELKERKEKEISIFVNIKSGGIGKTGICEMHQLFENGLFYFGNDLENLYEIKSYEWDGAKYSKVTKSQAQNKGEEKKRASGIAGAGFGIAGAGGKISSESQINSNGEVVEKEIEEVGSAIIRMRRIKDDITISFLIECDSEMDKKIRCFNNVPNQTNVIN